MKGAVSQDFPVIFCQSSSVIEGMDGWIFKRPPSKKVYSTCHNVPQVVVKWDTHIAIELNSCSARQKLPLFCRGRTMITWTRNFAIIWVRSICLRFSYGHGVERGYDAVGADSEVETGGNKYALHQRPNECVVPRSPASQYIVEEKDDGSCPTGTASTRYLPRPQSQIIISVNQNTCKDRPVHMPPSEISEWMRSRSLTKKFESVTGYNS